MLTTSRKKRESIQDYRVDLLSWLKEAPDHGSRYLNAAWREGPEAFLVALKDVVDARGGVTKLAKKTGMHRVSLHGVLSKAGNPRLENLSRILDALGIEVALTSKTIHKAATKRRAKAG